MGKGENTMMQQGFLVYRIIMQSDNIKNYMPDFQHSVVFTDKVKADEFKHEKMIHSCGLELWMSSEVQLDTESRNAD